MPQVSQVVTHTGSVHPLERKCLNVGDKLRRYKKLDVATYLACLSCPRGRQLYEVTSDAMKLCTGLYHENQLQLDPYFMFFHLLQLNANLFSYSST